MSAGFWLKAILSAAILAIVFVKVDLSAATQALLRVNLAWFLVGVSIAMPMGLTGAQRWRFVAADFGETLSLSKALIYTWIGQFINLGLPTLAGLDSMRTWKLHQQGIPIGRAARIVIIDRLCSLFTLLLIIALGMPHLFSLPGGSIFKYSTILALILGTLGLGMLSTLHLWERLIPLTGRAAYLYQLSRDFNQTLFGRKRLAIQMVFWSIANHLCRVAQVLCLAIALGIAMSPNDAFTLVPPALLIAMLPISLAGWGVREVVFIQAFGLVGIEPGSALALSLLYGIVGLVTGLFGGCVWFAEQKLQKPATK